MEAPLTQPVLKAKQRELRGGFPETMGLRVHRAISWIGRAEAAGDDDARFLFLWIGFNAAYADEEEVQNAAAPERDTRPFGRPRHGKTEGFEALPLHDTARVRRAMHRHDRSPW